MTISPGRFNMCILAAIVFFVFVVASPVSAQEKATKPQPPANVVTQLKIYGPDVLNKGINLVGVKAQYDGKKSWRIATYEEFEVVGDAGRLIPDVLGQSLNPATIDNQGAGVENGGCSTASERACYCGRCESGEIDIFQAVWANAVQHIEQLFLWF